jgi:hypothetical protein
MATSNSTPIYTILTDVTGLRVRDGHPYPDRPCSPITTLLTA